MSPEHYDPNSINAVLSRIETKLDAMLETQNEHADSIRKIWAHLGRLDVRVAVIGATGAAAVWFVDKFILK
jgi:hypothetical protein